MSDPLELHGSRILLRPITTHDIPAYEKHFIDYEVIRYLADTIPWPYPAHGVKDWMDSHILPLQGKNRWIWGLFLFEDISTLIGGIELWRPGSPENRGFWLGRSYWGRGLMTEAANLVTDYAFDQLEFETLVFSNAKGNRRSARIKEKTGARFIRCEPAGFVDPNYTEREIWELTKLEWSKHKALL